MSKDIDWGGISLWNRGLKCILTKIEIETYNKTGITIHVHPGLSHQLVAVFALSKLSSPLMEHEYKHIVTNWTTIVENAKVLTHEGQPFAYKVDTSVSGIELRDGDEVLMSIDNIEIDDGNYSDLVKTFQRWYVFQGVYDDPRKFIRARTRLELSRLTGILPTDTRHLNFSSNVEGVFTGRMFRLDGLHVMNADGSLDRLMRFEHFCEIGGIYVTRPQFAESVMEQGYVTTSWNTMDFWQQRYNKWNMIDTLGYELGKMRGVS